VNEIYSCLEVDAVHFWMVCVLEGLHDAQLDSFFCDCCGYNGIMR